MLERSDPDALHPLVDEEVVGRIDDATGVGETPYADVETLARKVDALFRFLVDVAGERAVTDYGTVARNCGVHAARLERLLVVLGFHEAVCDRPLLPAVVTRADREIPGDAYFRLVERVPDHADEVPSDPPTREWLWGTHRAAVYRRWAGRTAGGSDAESSPSSHTPY